MRLNQYGTELDDNLYPILVKEKSFNYVDELTSPEKIVQLFNNCFHLSKRTEEYVYMLCMTSKGKPLAIFEVSHGCINGSALNVREVFMKALLCNAANMVIIHNYPSGDVTPSKEDNQIYTRLREAGELMGIQLLDFIICARGYLSFHEKNL